MSRLVTILVLAAAMATGIVTAGCGGGDSPGTGDAPEVPFVINPDLGQDGGLDGHDVASDRLGDGAGDGEGEGGCQPSGSPCDDGDPCTVNDECRDGACAGDPVPCPSDGFPCTADACVDGTCRHDLLPGYCLIDGACWSDGQANPANTCEHCRSASNALEWAYTESDTCDDGELCTEMDTCVDRKCRGVPIHCPDDGLPCTQDGCSGGACVHPVLPGWCLFDGKCLADGQANELTPCLVCDPASPLQWTVLDGQPCSDGDPCTTGDTCHGASCVGVDVVCAADAFDCTDDLCASGSCVHPVRPGKCLVDGACRDAGDPDADDPCRGCVPGTSQIAWSDLDGASCDDGDPCTVNDTCGGGDCLGAPMPCPSDGLPCTLDHCVAGTCVHDVVELTCRIDGLCWSDGQPDPSNPCRGCWSGAPLLWSPVPGPCDDGDACTSGDACADGKCAGTPSVTCVAPDDCHEAGTCEPATGQCAHPAVPDGTPCDDLDPLTGNDRCMNGMCVSEACTCAGKNACCDGCFPVGEGLPCDDGSACTLGDACLHGACAPGTAVTCAPPAACREPGLCDPATGLCSYAVKGDGAACSDGDPCTSGDSCLGGGCVGSPVACPPDGLECTDDACVAGACPYAVKADRCLLDGACFLAGDAHPGDPCRACVPAASVSAWTPVSGTACDDGDPCTSSDTCDAGTCRGVPKACLPDGLDCTDDGCVGGICVHVPKPGWCLIGGACLADGVPDASNPCRACVAAKSPHDWSAIDGAPCADDGFPCTDDLCAGASCTHPVRAASCLIDGACRVEGEASAANECLRCASQSSKAQWTAMDGTACADDGLTCTRDSCAAGQCVHEIAAGSCAIGTTCASDGEARPGFQCQACVVATSKTAWTPLTGTACDDGDACTAPDLCVAGTCVPGTDTCGPPTCSYHKDCTPQNKVCGLWKTEGVTRCSALCSRPSDCAADQVCTHLPGSANVGYCQPGPNPAGADYGAACADSPDCKSDACSDSVCSQVCASHYDCPVGSTCLPAGDLVTGFGAYCEPNSGTQNPVGAACYYNSNECMSGHCDFIADYYMFQSTCRPICSSDGQCDGIAGEECNMVIRSENRIDAAVPWQQGEAKPFDAVLGCYARQYVTGATKQVGQYCSQNKECRSNKCRGNVGAGIQACTTYCAGDSDCPMSMKCGLVGSPVSSFWLAACGIIFSGCQTALPAEYSVARMCVFP